MGNAPQLPQGEQIPCSLCGRQTHESKAQCEPLAALEARLGRKPSGEDVRNAAMCGACAWEYRGGKKRERQTFSLLGSVERATVARRIAERRSFYVETPRGHRRTVSSAPKQAEKAS